VTYIRVVVWAKAHLPSSVSIYVDRAATTFRQCH
jgi:hypothetical protein